jgi:hypothetical protein
MTPLKCPVFFAKCEAAIMSWTVTLKVHIADEAEILYGRGLKG